MLMIPSLNTTVRMHAFLQRTKTNQDSLRLQHFSKVEIAISNIMKQVVSFGASGPASLRCWNGYDDAWLVSMLWNSIAPAFQSLLGTNDGDALNHQGQPEQPPVESANPQHGTQLEPEPEWEHYGAADVGVEWAGSCTCDCNGEGFGERHTGRYRQVASLFFCSSCVTALPTRVSAPS